MYTLKEPGVSGSWTQPYTSTSASGFEIIIFLGYIDPRKRCLDNEKNKFQGDFRVTDVSARKEPPSTSICSRRLALTVLRATQTNILRR